jgi:hypothetical protein
MIAKVTLFGKAYESGMGLPHSTTLARLLACWFFREVVECGSPMPLSRLDCAIRSIQPSVHRGGFRLSSFGFRHSFEFHLQWNAS